MLRFGVIALFILLGACGGGGEGSSSAGPVQAEQVRALALAAGQDPAFHVPSGPLPSEDAVVRVGQALFFSRTLSNDYDVACASCHHPLLAGADALSLPVGVASAQPWHLAGGRRVDFSLDQDPRRDCDMATATCGPNVPRNSPTIFNVALYSKALLWDGRVEALGEDEQGNPLIRTPESSPVVDPQAGTSLLSGQARLPVVSANEMRGFAGIDLVAPDDFRNFVTRRLAGEEDDLDDFVTSAESANWLSLFRAAWPDQVSELSDIRFELVQEALAAYQASLTFTDTPWSSWLKEEGEISEQALEGARLFFAPVADGGLGCAACHSGPRLTDEQFHNTGFPQIGRGRRANSSDPGREDVTRVAGDRFAFRTPSLLNVALTAPYGHAGTFQSLEDLLQYHAMPSAAFFEEAWSRLAQFEGQSLSATYPLSSGMLEEILASDNFAASKLPMRPLDENEIASLIAFLYVQTDACAVSALCLSQWLPAVGKMPEGDDPDGNQLNMGQLSEIDYERVPGEGEDPVSVLDLDFADGIERTAFAENSGFCISTAINYGTELFVSASASAIVGPGVSLFPVPAFDLGPDFAHGFAAADWFVGSYASVEPVMFAGGVTAAYLNDDCWPDLIFSAGQQGGLRFYTNRNGWYFNHQPDLLDWTGERPLGGYITGVSVADLNGDYRRELITGNLLASAAVDELTHESRDSLVVLGQRDDGRFYRAGALPFRRNTFGISFADVNGDHYLDMFTAHWGFGQPAGGSVFWQNIAGSQFVDAQDAFGLSEADGLSQQYNFTPSFIDANGNGWQDLLIASDFGTSQVLQNNPAGGGRRFAKVPAESAAISDENGMGGVVGDYDNDGDPDWFVTSIHSDDLDGSGYWGRTGNRLYQNNSSGESIVFDDVTEQAGVRRGDWGWGACVADFNNDGWLDIYHENGFSYIPPEHADFSPGGDAVGLYQNAASQFAFTAPRLFISNGREAGGAVSFNEAGADWGIDFASNGRGVVCLDYDRDGDIDVVSLDHSGEPRVLINKIGHGPGRRYLSVRLIGAAPNTEAIGGRVRVTADLDGSSNIGPGETQTRWVTANSTFNSQQLPDQHFGLGQAAAVDIEVIWPGDPVPLVCPGVEVNRFIVLDQRMKVCP